MGAQRDTWRWIKDNSKSLSCIYYSPGLAHSYTAQDPEQRDTNKQTLAEKKKKNALIQALRNKLSFVRQPTKMAHICV